MTAHARGGDFCTGVMAVRKDAGTVRPPNPSTGTEAAVLCAAALHIDETCWEGKIWHVDSINLVLGVPIYPHQATQWAVAPRTRRSRRSRGLQHCSGYRRALPAWSLDGAMPRGALSWQAVPADFASRKYARWLCVLGKSAADVALFA